MIKGLEMGILSWSVWVGLTWYLWKRDMEEPELGDKVI